MKYVTISDLKNQAKKIRKNNTAIKNHAESLDIIAKQNEFNNWTDLLDNAVILKSVNELTPQQRLSLLQKFINDLTIQINELTSMFKTDNYDVLSINITRHFLDPIEIYEATGGMGWRNLAVKWLDVLSFVFVQANITKTLQNYRDLSALNTLLEVIYKNNLQHEEKVIDFFDMINYEYSKTELIPPTPATLESHGYNAMQASRRFGFIDTLSNYIDLNSSIRKESIKNLVIKQSSLFLTKSFKDDINMFDPYEYFRKYRESFINEAEFEQQLKNDLASIT